MPFFPPFKKQFEEGDLVYGMHEQRGMYSNKFEFFKNSATPKNISTIDQYAATKVEQTLQHKYERVKPLKQADYLRTLSSHSKYKAICEAQGFNMNGRAVHHHQVIGRKCKAGLFWVSTLQDNTTVHFILDEIDLNMVAEKSHPRDQHGRSFTGVELRWIYRNRHNPQVMKKIQFWLKGSPTVPPWASDNSGFWQQYIPRSEPDWSASLSRLFHLA
ncbi:MULTISPECIES: hypothetical protein [unclassified Rahnella]|uniref:hypothetical protein n=1 Tax=unclassified Rahnella TaxID=2635087 RepID=UPI00102088FA|nr:hypothetical protein [Rahnella sp. RFA10(1/100)]